MHFLTILARIYPVVHLTIGESALEQQAVTLHEFVVLLIEHNPAGAAMTIFDPIGECGGGPVQDQRELAIRCWVWG